MRGDGRVRRPHRTRACTTPPPLHPRTAGWRRATTRSSCRTSACSTSSGYFVPGNRRRARFAWHRPSSGSRSARTPGTADAPFDEYARTRPQVILNINGSPYHHGKGAERLEICRARARQTGAWIVYVNAVGGQDELVFDGGSMVVVARRPGRRAGRDVRGGPRVVVKISKRRSGRPVVGAAEPPWPTGPEEVYRALVLGLGRLRAEERVPRGGDRDVGRASTRRWWRRSRPTRSGRTPCARSRCRRRTPRAESVEDARGLRRAPRASGSTRCRSRRVRRVPAHARRAVRGNRGGRRRGEPPGAHPRQPADGAVQQVRLARARDREQERVRGGVRHALRRHGGRVRAHQGRPQDARVRDRRVAERRTGPADAADPRRGS